MRDNEKGITLIELLAVIVIAFFVMGIIYSVAKLALDYHTVETTKAELQQEANYIVTELQRIHRSKNSGECYILYVSSEKVSVSEGLFETATSNCSVDPESQRLISEGYHYNLNNSIGNPTDSIKIEVVPNIGNLTLDSFRIASSENEKLLVEISTIISRYKNTESGG